jgi:amidophosphoribosyltransferase
MDEGRVIGVRDPHGFRPLVLGTLAMPDGTTGYVLASETAALDVLGAEFARDVEPGEMVVLGEAGGPRSVRFAEGRENLCVFELIYFARPDSYMLGRNLYEARRRMGEMLAREAPAEVDLVMPVPDTGAPAAAGYAEASGIPYREGMVRNRYAGRTFIQPSNGLRQRGVLVKLSALREQVRDKRLVVVDDSIVRGNTTRQIVGLLRRAGAREVHVRISAPPIFHPCFYGIDTQIETELIAATKSVDEIRAFIGADSLSYLSIGGVLDAIDLPRERFCFACFDGQYPVPVPYDAGNHKLVLEPTELAGAGVGGR